MSKRWFRIVVRGAVPALLIGLILWIALRNRRQDGTTLQVGAILPLTGPVASFGRSSQNAMILAQEDLRAQRPAVRIEIDFENSAADPKTALSALERLYRLKGRRVFVSSVSGVTLSLLPVVRRDGLLLFANAAHPDVTTGGGNVFRYSNTVESEARTIAASLPTLSLRRVFCLAVNDDYGKSYLSALQRLAQQQPSSFQIVGSDLYDRTTTDFRTMLAKAKASNPDAFVLIGFGRALGLLVRQLREGAFRGPFVASLGFVVTPEALESAGEGMRGGYFLTYSAVLDPRVQELRARYRNRFHEEPSPSIILDYAILFVLADAYHAVGTDPTKLANLIRSRQTFETPIGILTASDGANIVAAVRIQAVSSSGPIDLWGGP